MSSVEENLAKSLTAKSVDLIPFLPYLLQDLWDLGSSANDIIQIIRSKVDTYQDLRILDFACGKGAVSVNLAKELNCKVKGIDMISDFIDYAKAKAVEFDVADKCEFVAGDINEFVNSENGYDVVIFGAAGDILGDPETTINKLKQTVNPGGYIIIDDAYSKNDSGNYYTREQWLSMIDRAGASLITEVFFDEDALTELNDQQQKHIIGRAYELIQQYPDKKALFDGYIASQQSECDELENELIALTMLLQVI